MAQDHFREQALFFLRFQSEQRLGVADREQALHDPGLHLRVEIEQPHGVGDRGAALPDLLRDLFLAHPEFSREPRVTLRFLDRVQLGALQIFDQRKLEDFEIGRLPNDNGRFASPTSLAARQRRSPAISSNWPFTGLTISG